ncbi:hypothetical protein OO014_17400 [Intrasporangium calvum]|uniref:Uncharacterized protein n=1 Tax=Intrasporangium calvum TaxID=53358 RepID=A0ABT5GMC1_9MICO|nr:hypothetical protein [Intrasporangium calvum]MDC5699030.1 hypothetical protein [Intrasporangium calvum]
MGALGRVLRRTGTVAATTAAFTLAGTGIASAHHCYKDEWRQAAYEHLATSQTPWVSLSDLGKMFLLQDPALIEACGYVVDDAVADWMAEKGLTQEPLIQSRATVGAGAFYYKGTAPDPFEYLTDEDFNALGGAVFAGLESCSGGA